MRTVIIKETVITEFEFEEEMTDEEFAKIEKLFNKKVKDSKRVINIDELLEESLKKICPNNHVSVSCEYGIIESITFTKENENE